METATAGALYAASQIAQYGTAAYKALTVPTAPLKATFQKIRAPSLPRSSHTVTVIKGRVYIFGGEFTPRTPVDNEMHIIILPTTGSHQEADYQAVPARPAKDGGPVPEARVGHSASAIGDKIYIFGGRGGKAMKALEERGRVWVFDTGSKTWDVIDPNPDSPFPEARSYHTSAASTKPEPLVKQEANTASSDASDRIEEPVGKSIHAGYGAASAPYGTLFIHAGCTSNGGRASDLWSLDLSAASWSPFPSAPDPPRGGTSLALVGDRLYRYGGFDGTKELGGVIDYLDLAQGTFYDKAGAGEMSLAPGRSGWQTDVFADNESTNATPTDRSVAGFVPHSTGQGRNYILIFAGETTPSNKGHEGAGKFLGDVWSFQLKPEGGTAASLKDAVNGPVLGRETGERGLVKCQIFTEEGSRIDGEGGQQTPMGERGWFAADALPADVGGLGTGGFVVWGGIDEKNERLGDGYIVQVQ